MDMDRCVKCGSKQLDATDAPERVKVGGHVFTGRVDALRCRKCGEVYMSGPSLERFQLLAAARLAATGEASAAVFKYLRQSVGMRAADLAALLDVRPETLSRWETGALPVERRALAIVGALVVDQLPADERPPTLDRLRALQAPKKLPKSVRLGKVAAWLEAVAKPRISHEDGKAGN